MSFDVIHLLHATSNSINESMRYAATNIRMFIKGNIDDVDECASPTRHICAIFVHHRITYICISIMLV